MENSLVLIQELEQENLDFIEERKALQRKRRIREKRRKEMRKRKIIVSMLFSICILFVILSMKVLAQDNNKPTEIIEEPIIIERVEQQSGMKQLIEETSNNTIEELLIPEPENDVLGISDEYVYDITEEEIIMFKQIVSAETYDFWSYQDCLSIATIIVNRYNSVGQGFKRDWMSIFTQDNQFEVYSNGRYLEVPIHKAADEAVEAALRGEVNLNSEVMFFCTKDYYESCAPDDFFKTLEHVYTVRNVYFFTK